MLSHLKTALLLLGGLILLIWLGYYASLVRQGLHLEPFANEGTVALLGLLVGGACLSGALHRWIARSRPPGRQLHSL